MSGYLYPLELLPEGLQKVVIYLPFRAITGTPTEMASGLLSSTEIFFGLALQVFWLLVALILARRLWKRGLESYEAFGS